MTAEDSGTGFGARGEQPRRPVAPPIRSRARRPLGDEIRDAIAEDFISSGAVAAGERLPTEADLCEQYGVSRVTVRAALRSLQEAGFITVRQGRGSTVLPQSEILTSGIDRLCSFETFARNEARVVESADLDIQEIDAHGEVVHRLDIPPRTRTLVVRRVKVYDGTRIGLIVDYVPQGVLPFSTLVAEFEGSVLDVLLAHPELRVEYADCDVVPVALDRALAHQLEVKPGSPALYLDELTCTHDGRIVNWSQSWLLPDHLRFRIRRRRQFA